MHCITSTDGNVFVSLITPSGKKVFFKMTQAGKHLKHQNHSFPTEEMYQKAKIAWKKEETKLPDNLTHHVEKIMMTHPERKTLYPQKQSVPA